VDVTGVVYHRADAYGIVISKVKPHEDKDGAACLAPRTDRDPRPGGRT
jgi:hypothetical protein